MRLTARLLQNTHRITLFTRAGCGLCDTAKDVLHRVQTQKPFQLNEVDIAASNQAQWRDAYAFDIPVIHVEKIGSSETSFVPASHKLMHRFTEQDVTNLMNRVNAS